MIIACPKCSGPFDIPNDHISPLTQVACPHCKERMIFDFEAANDASLIEPGHGSASGFHTANDYHAAAGAGAISPAKQPTATAPEPVVAAPEPVVAAPEPAPEPVVAAPEPAVAAPEPAPEPAAKISDFRPAEPEPAPEAAPEPAPEPVVAAPEPAVAAPEPAVAAPEPATPTETKTERSAPHTPPVGDVVSKPPTEEAATPPEPADDSTSKPVTPEEKQAKPPAPTQKEGGNGLVMFLVFAIVALIAATYVTKGSFNPLDLFK